MRHEDAMQCAHDRVRRHQRLVWKHYDAEDELLHRQRRIPQQCSVVGRPRLAAWRSQHGECEWNAPRRGHRGHHRQRPGNAGVRKRHPTRDQPCEQCDWRHAAPHVVENLPARDGRQRVRGRTIRARNPAAQPWRELPVTTHPAVQSPARGEIAHRIVVEHLDVRHQSGARKRTLDEIVAEQRVHGKPSLDRTLEHRNLVDALAGERPLAEEILIDIGYRGRIRIKSGMPGKDGGVPRSIRTGERHAYARLENAVAPHHATHGFVEHGAIQRMRHGADEADRRIARKDGVGVQRHDKTDAAEPLGISLRSGERALVLPQDELVELNELAALPFPSHPPAVGRVELADAVEEIEWCPAAVRIGGIRRIEGTHALDAGRYDGVVAGLDLRIGVEEVAEQRKANLRVAIRQVLGFEMVECLVHRRYAPEQDRNDDDTAMCGRYAVLERHASEAIRRQQQRDELIHGGNRGVRRRDERKQHRGKHADPRDTFHRLQQQRQRRTNAQSERDEVEAARRPSCRAKDPLAKRWPIPDRPLERRQTLVDEVIAHVRGARDGTAAPLRRRRCLDSLPGNVVLGDVGSAREPLDDVAIAIARLERHAGIHARRIAAQHPFRRARSLDELRPVDAADLPQARDAVRHHELRHREMLCGALHRFLHAHHLIRDPLFDPQQRREVRAATPHLLQESREECGAQQRRVVDERVELARQRISAGVFRGEQPRHQRVGRAGVGHVGRRPQRHVPHILEKAHAQHRRHRPQLAHRQRCDALILLKHQLQHRQVEPAVRMGDQLDRDLVDPRIAVERTVTRQLRQLVVVVTRQGGTHLLDLLEDDVEVVEQPFAGGADLEALRGDARECVMNGSKHSFGRGKAGEQRPLAAQGGLLPGRLHDAL